MTGKILFLRYISPSLLPSAVLPCNRKDLLWQSLSRFDILSFSSEMRRVFRGKSAVEDFKRFSRRQGTRKESRFPVRLPFRFPPPRTMRKKLPGASSLQTFSFLSAIPFRYVFSRQIEIYKVFKAFPSAAGRTFPAQNIDNSPPPCAKRKISFSQTIFSSAEIKNRKCAIEAEE